MTVEIIEKHLPKFLGDAWLVKKGDRYFAVSSVNAFYSGWEVLVFPYDNDKRDVISWGDICGGRDIDHEEAIEQLDALTEEQITKRMGGEWE